MKDAIYDLMFDMEETYWWYVARRAIVLDRVRRVVQTLPPNVKPRILEYGCGSGMTLASLQHHADVFGIDASEKALAYCKIRGLSNLYQIDPEEPPNPANPFQKPFDVILLLDVLEHIQDEDSVLKILKTWLNPNGALIVTVPAFPFLWSGEDVVSHHLRRYTKKTLTDVLHSSGYKTTFGSYFNFFLFPIQASVILTNRFLKTSDETQTNIKPLPSPINSLLTWIVTAEKYFLKYVRFPIGGSILSVARPQQENISLTRKVRS